MLSQWDRQLFILINSQWNSEFLDWLMPAVTDLHKNDYFTKIFLPIVLLWWLFKQKKQALATLVLLSTCVGAVDLFTYRIAKPAFARPRPPESVNEIKLRTDRYAGFSFPSNHAANNFAGATILSYCYPASTGIAYFIAFTISYSRVYVGVHYPGDVIAGALLGLIFGFFFFKIWEIILIRIKRSNDDLFL